MCASPTFDPGAAARPDSGLFGLPATLRPQDAGVVVLPVPLEATCSYGGGTAAGPEAVLAASRQVELFDVETGRPYEAGLCLLPADPRVAAWNLEARAAAETVLAEGGVDPGRPELVQAAQDVNRVCGQVHAAVQQQVAHWLAQGKQVAVLGGDHSVTFGSVAAHAERYPGLGVLHVDAHADLRLAFEGFTWSHASILRNVLDRLPGVATLVQVGIRDLCEEEFAYAQSRPGRVHQHLDATLTAALHDGQSWTALCRKLVEPLPERVYVSFDIDGLEPALCPHTGTPVPGGLSYAQALSLLRVLGQSGRRVVGADLTEVVPGPEGDEWDANVGARVLYKLLGWMVKTAG